MTALTSPTPTSDGRFAASEALEIVALPYFELLGATVAEAGATIDAMFARIANSVHRHAPSGDLAAELLFATAPAQHQTYKAQTRAFFILRAIDRDADVLSTRLKDVMKSVEFTLREHEYSVERLVTEAQLDGLRTLLESVSTEAVAAIARQERVVGGTTGVSLYYNDVIKPAVDKNLSSLTNTLSQCPNSAVCLQLIPTSFSAEEIAGVERRRNYVDMVRTQLMMRPGSTVPSAYTDAAVSYVDFINEKNDNIFYFNFLVFSPRHNIATIAGRLIDAIEDDGIIGSNALTVVDVPSEEISLASGFNTSPWSNSDKLVYDSRESSFWSTRGAPTDLMRLRYLAPSRVVRAAFKVPFDDGRIIGLETRLSGANREKLHETVLSKDSFRIGEIIDADREATTAQAGAPLADFSRHALIVGASGYGKTNFALGMLLRLWRDFGIPFLVVEPTKTEYRSLLDAIPDINIFTPGKNNVSPFIINPFVPPSGVTVESYIPSLVTAFNAAFNLPDPLPGIFRSAINDCYNRYGWRSTSTSADPNVDRFGFYEFTRVFKERVRHLDYQGETRANIESAGVVRLNSLIELNPNIYDTVNSIPLEELLAQPTIIELNAIGDKEQKSLLMALLLVALCVYTKNNVALDGTLKNVFMLDEAHVLLGRSGESADARSATIEALEDMIAEIRAYGTGVVIADQSPANVGRNIVANTDIKVMFRLVERENRQMISAATSMDSNGEALLGRLGVGECMLHTGRLNMPLHVKADDVQVVSPMRASLADAEVRERTRFWEAHPELLIPHRECAANPSCEHDCDLAVRVDGDFLATKVATFYAPFISDWKSMEAFLTTKCGEAVTRAASTVPGFLVCQRLLGCATVKVARKLLLAKSISVSDMRVSTVLRSVVRGLDVSAAVEGSEGKANG